MPFETRIHHVQIELDASLIANWKLKRIMREVQREARILVAPGTGSYTTGALMKSIETEGPVRVGTIVTGFVGSRKSYAKIVESGAKIHDIFPKGAPHIYRFGRAGAPQLKFFWRKAGEVVYMPQVPGAAHKVGISHPGVKGKGFLIKPLRLAARKYKMRLINYDL